jgi:cytoskeletal protein CcmA (bactofilin family)
MSVRRAAWLRLLARPPALAQAPAAAVPAAPEQDPSRIELGCELAGRLLIRRPVRVEGEFRGELESASTVVVAEGGAVEGPIRARTVEIHGAVVGDVSASREVVIHAGGRLHGDVETPSLVIERGAVFNGRTHMYRPELALRAEAPAAPLGVVPSGE